ncbi:DUF1310 family protein [Gemella sanguinis]|jgi:hypothetical protein|uniref:DUF1310 family protein n=1 Tax=Gemella sanguinis TaxID=84135 RepID=UPI0028D7BFF4|nr:DUF1310 family protein [Gemella sanguinis]
MIEGDDVGKKALIGVSLAVLATVGVIGGKVYMNNNDNKIENIVKSDDAKQTIEEMLKKLDSKALTSEGKIKTYKIDESYSKVNPMGGIDIKIVINNNEKLVLETTLNKYSEGKGYKHGALGMTQELNSLLK